MRREQYEAPRICADAVSTKCWEIHHDGFIERWESEHIPNWEVTSYAFDRSAGRCFCEHSNVVHRQR